jgi:endonuclease/exonuclease/phosphatase family metal-dependent hydrolase
MADLRIASFNMHWGVSRRLSRYDIGSALQSLTADLVAVQEVWTPASGRDDLLLAANALGYTVTPCVMSASADFDGLKLDVGDAVTPGAWGSCWLHRHDSVTDWHIRLGHAPGDAPRLAHFLSVTLDGRRVDLVNVHLTHRFPLSIAQLCVAVRGLDRYRGPRVLVGDTNLPRSVAARLCGLRHAVRGPTFPAGRPMVQPDHILVSQHWSVVHSAVLPGLGSDHQAVVATLRL